MLTIFVVTEVLSDLSQKEIVHACKSYPFLTFHDASIGYYSAVAEKVSPKSSRLTSFTNRLAPDAFTPELWIMDQFFRKTALVGVLIGSLLFFPRT